MKKEKLRGIFRAGVCLAASLMAVMIGVYLLGAIIGRENIDSALNGHLIQKDPVKGAFFSCMISMTQNAAFIGTTIVLARLVWKKTCLDLGFTSLRKDWRELVTGIVLGSISITSVFLILLLTGSIKIIPFHGLQEKQVRILFLYFLSYIFVGFGEETFSRGGLMLALKETKSKLLVLGIPAIVFALLHISNNGVTMLAIGNLIIFALLAGYCFYKSCSIWLPIGFHIFWNFMQGSIYGLEVSGLDNSSLLEAKVVKKTVLTGGKFGPEGGVGATISLVLAFLYVIIHYRKKTEGEFFHE
ncbi:CPBP family intramembrane glutamic endopeptidase [[Clostridium] polysaccharolyticum]|uniref:CAAX prenyl protease 2/Lysostaphin resistance protein A-like domain-containing protein n=1 Tax=[Clostridium] polysaccharolyticum TaxID=29364 RepID=A0A1I0E7I1_9FIRM|nr:CPBP family intramembrane glutamic endopeptidase [[Clostridium] polysaccharolyticum]SET40795.1 hypothetical protein SAMN04487772_1192 [[Clostridium] polysaccharolyticum]